jgi:hypothetical protein
MTMCDRSALAAEAALEARARRTARKAGMVPRKWVGSIDNFGGYMLVDAISARAAALSWMRKTSSKSVKSWRAANNWRHRFPILVLN